MSRKLFRIRQAEQLSVRSLVHFPSSRAHANCISGSKGITHSDDQMNLGSDFVVNDYLTQPITGPEVLSNHSGPEDALAKRTNCLIMQRRKGGCACAQEIEEVHSVSASDYNGRRPGRGRSRPNREVKSQHCHCRCIRGPSHQKDYRARLKRRSPGWENFFAAVAYQFCLAFASSNRTTWGKPFSRALYIQLDLRFESS